MAPVQAREAPLLENGGESRTSMATNEQQTRCHASPGRESKGQKLDEKEVGSEEIDEDDAMSEESFASAVSQGYRTEEDDVATFEVSMVQLGLQNEELISDRWVKNSGSSRSQDHATDGKR